MSRYGFQRYYVRFAGITYIGKDGQNAVCFVCEQGRLIIQAF
jgi:hypothetical protein